jgi:hypothetical protein
MQIVIFLAAAAIAVLAPEAFARKETPKGYT